MAGMTSTPRPPALEHKGAATLLEPRPAPGGRTAAGTGATEVDDTGTVEALVAVTAKDRGAGRLP